MSEINMIPGLAIAGSSLRGISINARAAEAPRVADATIDYLG